jgi:hypothetical protein
MGYRGLRKLAILLVAGVAVTALPGVTGASARGSCVFEQRAVAHHAGGAILHPQPSGGPVACGMRTGFGGSEARVVLTNDGTAVYQPAVLSPGVAGTGFAAGAPGPHPQTQADPGGLAVSSDGGTSWRFVKPMGTYWTPQDDQLYVDRRTGRVFWYAMQPDVIPSDGLPLWEQSPFGYANLMTSRNDGSTWHHVAIPGYFASENPRFMSGPPPAGQPKPHGYPDVVYWCGNNVLFVYGARECWRSLDGGGSWQERGVLFHRGPSERPECGGGEEQFNDSDGNYPQAAPDGSLYVMVACGGQTFLAKSTDEAGSWPVVQHGGMPLTIPAADELRIDPAGNMYAVRLSGSHLLLRLSRDDGLTWTAPLDMTAPGVDTILQWFLAVRGPGDVAVSYLGERPGGSGYDGYLTETKDALATDPVFWSATVNDPKTPLTTDNGATPAKDDFIGGDIGPDGDAWGAFYEDCTSGSKSAVCTQGQGVDFEADMGYAARLSWPG